MAGKMGLGKQAKTGNSPCAWELVPMRLSDRAKIKLRNHLRKQGLQHLDASERVRTTSPRIDNPLCSIHWLYGGYCCA